MHYCDKNFKSKKALKEAVAARLAYTSAVKASKVSTNIEVPPAAPPVTVYNPEAGLGQEAPTPENGTCCVGGPHYPEPHKWYAEVTLQNGEVVKVK